MRTFSLHGGLIGLKIAALNVIDSVGYEHGPTFEKDVGSKGSPLREVIAMLTGIGLIVAPEFSVQRVPTLKGRFLLDLARLLFFERQRYSDWTPETKLILTHLKVDPADGWQEPPSGRCRHGFVTDLLASVAGARRQFGIDLMENVLLENPSFYSSFSASKFLAPRFHGASAALWDDQDDVIRFEK